MLLARMIIGMIIVVAECLSTRQLILHRISPSVCISVFVRLSCFRNGINFYAYTSDVTATLAVYFLQLHVHVGTETLPTA